MSFRNQQPSAQLFGHLTPALLMKMEDLVKLAGKESMENFKVFITQIKPAGDHEPEIKKQLLSANKLALQLIFPQQAQMIKM